MDKKKKKSKPNQAKKQTKYKKKTLIWRKGKRQKGEIQTSKKKGVKTKKSWWNLVKMTASVFNHVSLDKDYCHAFYFGVIKVLLSVSDIIWKLPLFLFLIFSNSK